MDRGEVISLSFLALQVRLTKKLRRGLVLLDGHMSSSRWNEKHLKVTFVTVAAAAAGAAAVA